MKKTMPKQDSFQYQSFLIRLWQDDADAPWRISAKHVATGEQKVFNSLERFFVYLQAQTETAVERNPLFLPNDSDE